MRKYVLFLFLAISIAEVCSQSFELDYIHLLCKPLLMPLLGLYFFMSVRWSTQTALVLMALLLSFLGDSFLMVQSADEKYFMFGLGSFLVAHIFYAIVYPRHTFYLESSQLANVQIVRMALPVIMAGTGLVVILYPVLGALRVPVIIYAVVLMIMVLQAIFRYKKTSAQSFALVFSGAVLFMISDSLIALNKFLHAIPAERFFIMSTYIAGQFLIVQGLINHQNLPEPVFSED